MRTLLPLALLVTCSIGCGAPKNGTFGPESKNFMDNQVLGLAVVETDHQVRVAMAALQRGLVYPQITDYAQRLIDEMAPARDRLLAIGTEQGLQADQSTVEARTNLGDTSDDIALIQPPVSGIDVDRVYMPDSVHDTQKAIEIWDNTLLPNVSNAALRQELGATRALLTAELALGMQVLNEIGLPLKQSY